MIHVLCDWFDAPPDGTFHVDCDEAPNLPVEHGAGNVDAEPSGPSPGMSIEVPGGTSHVDSDEVLNLADDHDVDRD